MAIVLSGAKYGSTSISTAYANDIKISTGTFVSGDFATRRMVALFSSSSVFKGIGFVRRWVSTSQLELEKPIFDPATGIEATQAVGDLVLISKKASECVVAGWAVSGNTVTVTTQVTFGTANSQTSLCFYDGNLQINSNSILLFAGGVTVFGKMDDYDNNEISSSCNFYYTTPASSSLFRVTNAAASVMMYGGAILGLNSPSYIGGYQGSGPKTLVLNKVYTAFDLISPGAGGTWGASASRCQLVDCFSETNKSNAIMVRWGDGEIRGGKYRVPNNATAPLSIFGTDTAGSYNLIAPAGKRGVVLDIGSGNIFIRTNVAIVVNYTIENFISTDLRITHGSSNSVNNNGTLNYYFRDTYSNLLSNSVVSLIRDSTWVADDTKTSASGENVSPRVYWQQVVGFTLGGQRGPWTARVRKFGYDEIENVVAESNYSLGTAGTAKNVTFGGYQNQIARDSLYGITEAMADAYAGVTITNHGASPVTWNGKVFSITVVVDTTTYPSRTASEVFAHIKSGIAKSTTFNGVTGILWHVLVEEAFGKYVSKRGKSGGAGASLKGVRVIDSNGNPFAGFIQMQADDGTYYVPPIAYTLTFTDIKVGSDIVILQAGTEVELANIDAVTGSSYAFSYQIQQSIDIAVYLRGYVPFVIRNYLLGASDSSLPISQIVDRNYLE